MKTTKQLHRLYEQWNRQTRQHKKKNDVIYQTEFIIFYLDFISNIFFK